MERPDFTCRVLLICSGQTPRLYLGKFKKDKTGLIRQAMGDTPEHSQAVICAQTIGAKAWASYAHTGGSDSALVIRSFVPQCPSPEVIESLIETADLIS